MGGIRHTTIRRNRWLLAAYHLEVLMDTAISGVLPLAFGSSMQAAVADSRGATVSLAGFRNTLLLVLLLFVLQLMRQFTQRLFERSYCQYWIGETLRKLSRLQLRTLAGMGAGNLNQRSVQEVEESASYFTDCIGKVAGSVILVIAASIMLFTILPSFTVTLILMLAICVPMGLRMMKIARARLRLCSESWALFISATTDFAASQLQLRSSHAETRMLNHLKAGLQNYLALDLRTFSFMVLLLLGFVLLLGGILAGSVELVGKLNLMGSINTSGFFAFLGYLLLLFTRAMSLSSFLGSMQGSRVKLERIDQIFSLDEDSCGPGEELISPSVLQVRNLSGAIEGKEIFAGISFSCRSGEILLIKGPSGCGKSTLLKVLFGMEKRTAGEMSIDGRLVDNLMCLGDSVMLMPQELRFFHGSLRMNMELLSGATFDEDLLFAVLKKLRLDDRFKRDSAETGDLVEAGQNLSGGEKQRLALAAMLLRKPVIALLDEPTSQIDPESEAVFLEMVQSLARDGAIVIMVAHKGLAEGVASRVLVFGREIEFDAG
jgi:ABC-type bacteriocin/lantibiotic exporter with double-glycine peptidase domain